MTLKETGIHISDVLVHVEIHNEEILNFLMSRVYIQSSQYPRIIVKIFSSAAEETLSIRLLSR